MISEIYRDATPETCTCDIERNGGIKLPFQAMKRDAYSSFKDCIGQSDSFGTTKGEQIKGD